MSDNEEHVQLQLNLIPKVNIVDIGTSQVESSTTTTDISNAMTNPSPSVESTPTKNDSTPLLQCTSTPAPISESVTSTDPETKDTEVEIAALNTSEISRVEAMEGSDNESPTLSWDSPRSPSRSETPLKESTPAEMSDDDEISFKIVETPDGGEGSEESRKRKRVSERKPRKPARYSPDQDMEESNSSVSSKSTSIVEPNTSKGSSTDSGRAPKRVMRQRQRVGQDDIVSKKIILTCAKHASVEFGVPEDIIVDIEVMQSGNEDYIDGREEREKLAAKSAAASVRTVPKVEDWSEIKDELVIKDEFDLEDEMLNVMSGKKVESIKSEVASSRESSVSRAEHLPIAGIKKAKEVLAHLVKFGKSQAEVKALSTQLKTMKKEDREEEINVKISELDIELKGKIKELALKVEQVDEDSDTEDNNEGQAEIKKLTEQIQASFIKKVALDVTLLDDKILRDIDLKELKGVVSKKDNVDLKAKIEALETKNKQLSLDKTKMAKELKTIKSDKLDAEEQLKDLKSDLQNKDKIMLTDEIEKLKKDKNTLRAYKKQLTEENQELQSRLNKAEEVRKLESNFSEPVQDLTTLSTNKDMEGLQIELEFYKEENSALKNKLDKASCDNDTEKLTRKIADLKKENEAISKDKTSYKNRLNDMRKYRDKYDVLKKEKKESETKIEEYQAKISSLQNETKSHSNLESARLKELEEELRKERDALKEEKENVSKEVAALKLQITTFQSKEQDLKTESENMKELLQKEKDITTQNSLELEKLKIAETSLQELLKSKVEKEEDLKNELNMSKQNYENRIEVLGNELKKSYELESTHKNDKIEFETKLNRAHGNLKSEQEKLEHLTGVNETLAFQVKVLKNKLGGDTDGTLDIEVHNKLSKSLEELANERKLVAEFKEKVQSAEEEKSQVTMKIETQNKEISRLEENVKNSDMVLEENEKLKLEVKTLQEDIKKKDEMAEDKESKLVSDFNEKLKANNECISKCQEEVNDLNKQKESLLKDLEDIQAEKSSEKEQKQQEIENLQKKYEISLLEEEKEKDNLKITMKNLQEENESLKGDIRYTSAENEKTLKELNRLKSDLSRKSSLMESMEAKNKELEGNYKTLTQKYEAEKRLESLSHREIDKEKSTLNIKLEKASRDLEHKDEEIRRLKGQYDKVLMDKVIPQEEKIKGLQSKLQQLGGIISSDEASSASSSAPVTLPSIPSSNITPKLTLRSFESLSAQPSAAPDILQNIMPAPLSSLTDPPFQTKRTGVVAPLSHTNENQSIPKAQVLPTNRGRDPRLQGASDRDPRMQTSAERDSRHGADRDPRPGSLRDPRSSDPRTYSSTSERDSRYPSSSDRDSRYYSSSDRDRESRHRSPPGRDSRDSLERQRSSYDRSTSSSDRGDRDHRDHRPVDRQYSSTDRRDRDHRSQTSSERDRYRDTDRDRDRGHYSSSGRDRSRHSPDRERRRHPSPDRHHSERDPRRLLTSSRITSPAGGRSPSYSPSPLQSPVPSPVPPPLFGRPLPPVAPTPPPSRDPRMAAASATSRSSSSVTAATMEKQLFDGLKEALEEAKQDQSGEDVEQKYDELLNNLLESMPDEEEQILNALDRAFVCVFGRTAKKRSRQTPSAVTPPTPQPPINLFQNLPNIASFSAPQPISGPFPVQTSQASGYQREEVDFNDNNSSSPIDGELFIAE